MSVFAIYKPERALKPREVVRFQNSDLDKLRAMAIVPEPKKREWWRR